MNLNRFVDRGLLVSLVLVAAALPISIAASQLALGLVVLFWLAKLIGGYRSRMLLTPLSLGLVAWVAATLIAALFGDNPRVSLIAMREEWLFLAFFALWGGIVRKHYLRPILIALGTTLLLAGSYSIWQHFTGLDLVHQVLLDPMPSGYRAHATLTHSLTAGAVLSILGLLLLFLYFTSQTATRWLGLLVAISGLLGALLTYSRSVLLAVAVALLALFLLLWRSYGWRVLLPGLLLVAALLAIAPDLTFRFSQPSVVTTSRGRKLEAAPERLEIWQTAWNVFLARPLTGVGEDNLLGRYEQYAPPGSQRVFATAHNDLLHVAATRG
ncbi:MAG: O-antigen ligase family protein, partial [bacterium]